MSNNDPAVTFNRFVAVTLLAWMTMVGFDLLLHGGLLAPFYVADDPFLLPPAEAFRLIPLGYASFLLLAILLVGLMKRLDIRTAKRAAVFGGSIGGLIWGSWVLGLASITTARYGLLAGWFLGQTVEMSLAGAVAGTAFARKRLRGVVLLVFVLVVACFAFTVVLQSAGLAPVEHLNANS